VYSRHSAQQGPVVIEWSRNTHTTNTATFSEPSVSVIVELVLLHGNTRYVILVDVIQTIVQRFRETGNATSAPHVNLGLPRTVWTPANKGSITAAVERKPWRSLRDIAREFGLSQRSTLWRSTASIPLLLECIYVSRRSPSTDAILRIAKILTHCMWALFA
jgi:hypothetical protein